MPPAVIPRNETARLASLMSCNVLDTPDDPIFDDITQMAAELLDVPICAVSLVDEARQWFKSRYGLDATETPRDVAFCAHAILGDQTLVIEDATQDERTRDNPLVTGELGIRFYAGHPLILDDGSAVGTLCVIDTKTRSISEKQLGILRRLAGQITQLLHLYRESNRSKLAHTEARSLRQALNEHTLFSITDRAGRIVDVNDGFCKISGYSRDELLGNDHRMLNSGHHARSFWKNMWRTITAGKHWRAEVCNRAKDGSIYWVDSTNIPKFDDTNQVVGFVSLRFDITDKKRVESELEDIRLQLANQQERLELAIEGTTDGLWDWPDVGSDEEWWSPQFYQLLGYEPDELPSTLASFKSILHPDDMDRCFLAVQDAWAGKRDFDIEYRLKTRDRGYRWFRGRAKLYRVTGKPDRMAGSICDIQSVHDAKSELEALEQQMRLFVEHTPAAVAMFDRDMRYLLVSQGWVEQYQLHDEQIIGRTHYEIFPTVPERWKTIHKRVLAGETVHQDRDRFESEDGKTIWVRWTLRPWHRSDGEIGGVMMFTQVINQQIEYERELQEAVNRAEAASKAKSEFLANMSHEIRTPMAAILGYSDLIGGDLADDPTQAADAVRTIQSNANHLLTIINDILDVSKIEAGQMAVEAIETNPTQIISEVLSLVRPRAASKGVQVSVVYDTPIPETIQSDPTRLRQILLNLLGNAIKFTEVGSVTVHASCDPNAQQLKLNVVDTGIGMSPEQCELISKFDAFSQADASTTRKFGGTGLGLRISNALAQMLGGGIEVTSVQGQGSTFTATITTGDLSAVDMLHPQEAFAAKPRKPAKPQAQTTTQPESAKPLDGLRVLLAEDGPDNQRLISFHLKKAGAEVTICENGRIAVEALENMVNDHLPSVVLMDMQMPELDGYSATRRLRDQGVKIPIIALTAHAMEGDRQKCLDSGCDDYLTKPIDKELLIDTCLSWSQNTAKRDYCRQQI